MGAYRKTTDGFIRITTASDTRVVSGTILAAMQTVFMGYVMLVVLRQRQRRHGR